MDALFIASYIARQNAIATTQTNSDRLYDQAGGGGWMLAPLASALGIVGVWAGPQSDPDCLIYSAAAARPVSGLSGFQR